MLVARPGHPILSASSLTPAALAEYPWVVNRTGTPTRAHFDRLFEGGPAPRSIVELGSVILMRGLLAASDHLGCVSRLQAEGEGAALAILPYAMPGTARPIGLTLRAGWLPTGAQRDFVAMLGAEGRAVGGE